MRIKKSPTYIQIVTQVVSVVSERAFSVSSLLLTILLTVTLVDARPGRNGRIAFASDRDGNREIYVMNPDGSGQTRLTNNNFIDDHPTWSPDGKKIAFLSQRAGGQYGIFVMNGDGTNRVEVTSVTYSPPAPNDLFGWRHMSWSPDGARLVFTDVVFTVPTLVIVNSDGTNRHELTEGFYPAWSPLGSTILFMKNVPNAFVNLYAIRPDGTDLRFIALSFNNPGYLLWYSPPAWSPDGRKFVVNSTDTANSELNIVNADGTNPVLFAHICTPLVPSGCGANTAMPTWSPDGRSIAFAQWSYASTSIEIYTQDLDEMSPVRITSLTGNDSSPSWQRLPRANFDFDGDGRSDTSVFRPGNSAWYLNRSAQGFFATQFGIPTDKIVPADYDGDGKTDIAILRDGAWWRIDSSDSTVRVVQFGVPGDIPVPADYTGDGRDELAVYRNGEWWTFDLADGQSTFVRWGLPSDRAVVADYDGDGRADPAVYRDGEWYLLRSSLGSAVLPFGLPTDKPVVADYDGDARADIAVFRNGVWYSLQSGAGFATFQFGIGTDVPVPADYDGDGKADAAIFRNGEWWLRQSTTGIAVHQFGEAGDSPIPSAYVH